MQDTLCYFNDKSVPFNVSPVEPHGWGETMEVRISISTNALIQRANMFDEEDATMPSPFRFRLHTAIQNAIKNVPGAKLLHGLFPGGQCGKVATTFTYMFERTAEWKNVKAFRNAIIHALSGDRVLKFDKKFRQD